MPRTGPAPSARALVFWAHAAAFFLSCVLRSANASLDDVVRNAFGLGEARAGLLSSLFFLAFAITQLPLGYLIDRVGPRRAQLLVLPLAIGGLVLTAYATDFLALAAGRILLGAGFAISLMASLCANRAWFPLASLAAVNGAAMGIGSSGAAFAGTPLAILAVSMGWSGLHLAMASATLLVFLLMFALPDDTPAAAGGANEARLVQVLQDAVFRRLVPLAALAQGAYLAYLGYWIHPWLRNVAGYDVARASLGLSLVALTMVAGYLLTGRILRGLARWGWSLEAGSILGMVAFAASGLALAVLPATTALPLWLIYGFTGALNVVAFSVLSTSLPQSIQGTAVTLMNLLIFVAGFLIQAALGFGIEWMKASGIDAASAHRIALLVPSVAMFALAARWRRLHGPARAIAAEPAGTESAGAGSRHRSSSTATRSRSPVSSR